MSARTQSTGTAISGTLYVVATPIGNLSDLTARAREVLAGVAAIAAEDTRHTAAMLKSVGIATPLVSLHEHNESRRAAELIKRLRSGESLALVSDAGTPLISDPGFDLVRAAIGAGIRAVPIPGACAVIAALSISGLATDRFVFEGFLPAKEQQRRDRLRDLANESRTLVFYEGPHRLQATLRDLQLIFGEARQAVVARELTKQFETIYRGTLQALSALAADDSDMSRGEIVILVAGDDAPQKISVDANHVLRALLSELTPAQAAKLTARITGEKRDDLYRQAVELGSKA